MATSVDRPTASPSPLWDGRRARYKGASEISRDRWRAVIRLSGVRHHLGTAPTARQAAAITAGYLCGLWGSDWPAKYAAHVRQQRRYSASRRHAGPAPEAEQYRLVVRPDGRLRLDAWVDGLAVRVRHRLFPDAAAALAYFRAWKYREFGLFAHLSLGQRNRGPKLPGGAG